MRRFLVFLLPLFFGISSLKAQSTPVNNWTKPVNNWTRQVQVSTPVEQQSTPVQQSRPVKLTRGEVRLSKQVELSQAVQMSTWTELSKPVSFTKLVELSKKIELSNPVELSKSVELSHYVDFSRAVLLSRAVSMSKQVSLSTSVEMSKLVELSKSVPMSEIAELSMLVNLSNITDLSTVIQQKRQEYLAGHGLSLETPSQNDLATSMEMANRAYNYILKGEAKIWGFFSAAPDDAVKEWQAKYNQSVVDNNPSFTYLYLTVASSLFDSENIKKTVGALTLIAGDPAIIGDILPGSAGLGKLVEESSAFEKEAQVSENTLSTAIEGRLAGNSGATSKLINEESKTIATEIKTGTTVLGKYPDYVNLSSELNAKNFNIPPNVWNKMTAEERWMANSKFLDRAIKRGDKIVLSNKITDINQVTGTLRKELDYLISKGYRISDDGLQMVKWYE